MSEIDTRLKELAGKLNEAARNAFYRGARQEQADLISAHGYLLEYAAQLEINEWQESEIARLRGELKAANENIDNLRREANTAHRNERDMSRIIWNAHKKNDLRGLAKYVAAVEAEVRI